MTPTIRQILVTSLALLALTPAGLVHAQIGRNNSNVAATKHNLSSTGPGTVKVGGGDVCIYCHTPHAANPIAPLWNRDDPGTYYETYDSTTLISSVGQPTGSSRLCLSCHDGTIALSQTFNPRNTPVGHTVYISAGDRGYIGTDLSDDHPVSQVYDTSVAARQGELRDPRTLPAELPLDHEGRLQCTTCHDPHDDGFGKFLRMDSRESRLCTACHTPEGWTTSPHATSTAALGTASGDDWSNLLHAGSVREAGCESCHRPHTAGGRQRLLRHEAEENNCVNCHDGSVASTDIAAAIRRISTHPVDRTTGVHDPTENPANMREHVECVDCHDPHRSNATGSATAPFIKPGMSGASGLSSTGGFVEQATYEYEVCYKCHSQRNAATPVVDRVLGTNNIADEFSTSGRSYHPVEAAGRATFMPSLVQGYTKSSIIYCTDCHGSDDGAKGPHGSRFKPLLSENYDTLDRTGESAQAFELCYKCHNRQSILNNESFSEHRRHIVEENVPCSVCHDPHGVSENTHLINFDRDVVRASGGQGPSFEDRGDRRGACTVSCHGETHVNESYPEDD